MKTFYRIGFFLVVTIASFSIAGILIVSRGEEMFGEDSKWVERIDEEHSLDFTDVTEINLSVVSADIRFYPSTETTGKVIIEGESFSMGWKQPIKYDVRKDNDTIYVEEDSSKWGDIGINFSDVIIKVYIPEGYSDNLTIKAVSADVKLDGFSFGDLLIETVSGDIEFNNTSASKLTVKTVSGDMELSEFICEEVTFKSVSGDVELGLDSTVFYIDINTTSGDADIDLLNDATFRYDLSSLSGDLSIKVNQLNNDSSKNLKGVIDNSSNTIKFTSVSGDIDIR